MKCTVITHEFARKSGEISPASLMITIKLMNYISLSTGFIVDTNGKLLTNRDIQSITGYTSRTVKKSMVELVEQGLFTREKRGRFYVYHANPMYMMEVSKYDHSTRRTLWCREVHMGNRVYQ